MNYSKLSDYKVKKIIRFSSADVDAIKASILLDCNRKTMNRYYLMFRECVHIKQTPAVNCFQTNEATR